MANETNQKLENEELEVEEVNVYTNNCGTTKTHCMYDCEIFHNSILSTAH